MEKRKVVKKKRRSRSTAKTASSSRRTASTRSSRRVKRLNPITRLSWPGDDVGQGLSNDTSTSNNISSIINGGDSLLMKKQLSQSSQSQSFTFSSTKSPSYLFDKSDNDNGNKRLKAASKRHQTSSSLSSSVRTSRYRKNITKNGTNRGNRDNQLWVDKYRPTNIKDLCVAPKKISEVREWVEHFNNNGSSSNDNNHSYSQYHGSNNINNNSSKLLILVGSGGIGKSTLIHVLAKELHWKVSQWNELHNVKISSPTSSAASSSIFISPESQLSSFEEFLSSSALGCNIALVNDPGSTIENGSDSDGDAISKCNYRRPLVLIDGIPNLHSVQNEARFRYVYTTTWNYM